MILSMEPCTSKQAAATAHGVAAAPLTRLARRVTFAPVAREMACVAEVRILLPVHT